MVVMGMFLAGTMGLACSPEEGPPEPKPSVADESVALAADDATPTPGTRNPVAVDGSPALGPEGAPVTLVEFADFQCPYCARATKILDQLRDRYGDQLRIVFKHFPLEIHPKAPAAHVAAEAAHRQGKFWEMHDLIFANQREMSEDRYLAYAGALGLDIEQFQEDRRSLDVRKRVLEDAEQAVELGILGTPAFVINGRIVSGAQPLDAFQKVIDEELSSRNGVAREGDALKPPGERPPA
jgi:protein-disulfide isomerase